MIEFQVEDGIALVRLARPPANAMNQELLAELGAISKRVEGDEVRAVVITGSGRFFSAGLDLFALLALDEAAFTGFARTFDAAFEALFAIDKPVVAAINGHAMAGGAVLAATADFRLMAEGVGRIGLTEILVGVALPTSAFEPVRFAFGGPHLGEVLLRGQGYGAAAAATRGLVHEALAEADLLPRARALATELGSSPSHAYAKIKQALRAEARAKIRAACAGGYDRIWDGWRNPETLAAIMAYRQRVVESKNRKEGA